MLKKLFPFSNFLSEAITLVERSPAINVSFISFSIFVYDYVIVRFIYFIDSTRAKL
jgi:hypothetical protein